MSLLIKALDKAQEAKALEAKAQAAKSTQVEQVNLQQKQTDKSPEMPFQSTAARNPLSENDVTKSAVNAASAKLAAANALEMELSPVSNKNINDPDIFSVNSTVKSQESASANKKSANDAANVFAAKRIESNNQNTILALIAGVGLCVLLAIAIYFYLQMNQTPDFVAQRPVALPANVAPAQLSIAESAAIAVDKPIVEPAIQSQPAPPELESTIAPSPAVDPAKTITKSAFEKNESLTENEVLVDDAVVERLADDESNQIKTSAVTATQVQEIASKSASIQVSKNQAKNGVNSVLMEAFNAYNAGNDAVAGKLYRQVLQRDVRNLDALLGLGAIAQRQGRISDANGWYSKVLEIEPRNVLANTAILSNQPQNDVISKQSRIKSMLAKQPDDANLHATLGNFYADLNEWSAAQQAYFDAYRLNASADNAYNLAISLDQLGKPKLALPYYQRALELSQSTASNIDKAALQARIAAIQ